MKGYSNHNFIPTKFVWFFTSVKDFEPCSNGVYSNPCFPLFVYIIWCTVKQFFTFLVGLCYKYSKLGYSVYTLALITDTKGFKYLSISENQLEQEIERVTTSHACVNSFINSKADTLHGNPNYWIHVPVFPIKFFFELN